MIGHLTPEMYARWIQFGAFSPILRTHATKLPSCERRVWKFPEPYSQAMAAAIRRRYEMVPYIYTENRRCFDSGVSLVHPMYYHWPECDQAYAAPQQYLFGESLLVAPVVAPADGQDEMAPVSVWLPDGLWFDLALGQFVRGGRTLRRRYLIDEVPVFARPGAVIPGQQAPTRLQPGSYRDLVVTIVPGPRGSYDLYEDDGLTTEYLGGASATIPISHRATAAGGRTITIGRARGSFDGFLNRRTLEIRLPASAPPKAVTVGRKNLPWRQRLAAEGWTYDGQTATTVIRLAAFDVTRGLTVTVLADRSQPARLADGLAGLLRRLDLVGRHNNLASPAFAFYHHERLAVDTAQTGNRISRRPETFAAEVRRLRRLLKKLPTALREYQDAYIKRKLPDQAGYLANARAVLKTTLEQF
jgi:alpha-glucosidase